MNPKNLVKITNVVPMTLIFYFAIVKGLNVKRVTAVVLSKIINLVSRTVDARESAGKQELKIVMIAAVTMSLFCD